MSAYQLLDLAKAGELPGAKPPTIYRALEFLTASAWFTASPPPTAIWPASTPITRITAVASFWCAMVVAMSTNSRQSTANTDINVVNKQSVTVQQTSAARASSPARIPPPKI